MTKEFIPYEEALALKELGFNEPCFDSYESKGFMGQKANNTTEWVKQNKDCCSAPLYQQAFRWFREKHNLYHDHTFLNDGTWDFEISGSNDSEFNGCVYGKSYEEGELKCLRAMIYIVERSKK